MASLVKGLRFASQIKAKSPLVLCTFTRNHWNKDWKPAPYPETDKAREAAAKKYYLLPEEYRPYADDGLGYGDYPELPTGLGVEARDNFYPYDFPEHKRNFNEPLHADIDLYGEDRYSLPEKPRYPTAYYFSCFFACMAFCFITYYWLEDKKMYRPVAPRQYPGEGRVHYTFERES